MRLCELRGNSEGDFSGEIQVGGMSTPAREEVWYSSRQEGPSLGHPKNMNSELHC